MDINANDKVQYHFQVKQEATTYTKTIVVNTDKYCPSQDNYLSDVPAPVKEEYTEGDENISEDLGPSFIEYNEYLDDFEEKYNINCAIAKLDKELKPPDSIKTTNNEGETTKRHTEHRAALRRGKAKHRKKATTTMFVCEHCNRRSSSKSRLTMHLFRKHLLTHLPQCKRKFPCLGYKGCNHSTSTQENLNNHLVNAHGERQHLKKCKFSQCSYTTVYNISLKRHQKTHLGMPKTKFHVSCPYDGCTYTGTCNYEHAQKPLLRAHFAKAHGETKHLKKCSLCSYTTVHGFSLKAHLATHLGKSERGYKCSKCEFSAIKKANFLHHLALKHGDKEHLLKCKNCDFITGNKYVLNVHMQKHYLVCPHTGCDFNVSTTSMLRVHLAQEHKAKYRLMNCEFCDYTTTYAQIFRRHVSSHFPGDGNFYKCIYSGCSYSASKKSYLNTHLGRVHGETAYLKKCPNCDYSNAVKRKLKSHIKTHEKHPNENCSKCSYSTANAYRFRKHTALHLKCSFSDCEYTAIKKESIVRHLLKHKDEDGKIVNLKKCANCNFLTTDLCSLKKHVFSHLSAKVKAFMCGHAGCSFAAATKKNLKVHLRKHEAHKCTYCNFSTVNASQLKKHSKTHSLGGKTTKRAPSKNYYAETNVLKNRPLSRNSGIQSETHVVKLCPHNGCGFRAKGQKSLVVHMAEKHREMKSLIVSLRRIDAK